MFQAQRGPYADRELHYGFRAARGSHAPPAAGVAPCAAGLRHQSRATGSRILAPQSSEQIGLAQLACQGRCQCLEYGIARCTTMQIVDALEVVSVDHQQADRMPIAPGLLELPVDGFCPGPGG